MASPKEIIAQLLSPAQAETLAATGDAVWQAAAELFGQSSGSVPGLGEPQGRLVMPEEVIDEYTGAHLVLPISITTDQEQSATAYAIALTADLGAYFGVDGVDPEEVGPMVTLIGGTILRQVVEGINTKVASRSPVGLKFTPGEIAGDAMPALLGAMDEPALAFNATMLGEAPLAFSLILPGTFLDIVAGAIPAAAAAPAAAPAPSPAVQAAPIAPPSASAPVAFNPPQATAFSFAPAGDPDDFGSPLSEFAAPEPAPARREPTPIAQGPTAHRARFTPLPDPEPSASRAGMDLLAGLQMSVTVELGRTDLTVAEVLGLGPGSVVELDRVAGEPVDILVNDRLIARGEVVVVDENFGVRIVEVVRRNGESEERAS